MPKIFISYRREDSQYVADIIHEYMVRHFGEENVFLDVGSIPFGVDFRKYITDQIAAHDVVLVLIGPTWASVMEERVEQDNDFVRLEIESALNQGKLVVPVLVMEAEMPSFSNLPQSIAELQWRNSATIRRKPDLENDCNRLAEGIKQYAVATDSPLSYSDIVEKSASLDLLPAPFAWISIPVGKVMLGADINSYIKADTVVDVDAYEIAQYTITNSQYAQFIEADGYKESKWWTTNGWSLRQNNDWIQPRYWTDPKLNSNDQPVVGISWYEALAFCFWLKEETDENITLPTEAEWQFAAQGTDGRLYPWGNDFSKSLCNYKAETTTMVNKYPRASSPFGVMDLAGNTWEWCCNDFLEGTCKLADHSAKRSIRGGSSTIPYPHARNMTHRSATSPETRSPAGSFRIVRK